MYDRDMPRIAAHALRSPQGLVDVVGFVLCTIQQPFQGTARQMADIRANGAESKYLFGAKRPGYQYALDHKDVLFAAVKEAVRVNDVIGAVDVLTAIPGLGIVKAAFVAQLCGLEVACLDVHNLRSLGMPETALRLAKGVKPETRRAKIAAYVALCTTTGGASSWWNKWCQHVAGRRNSPLKTAEEVSAFHCVALGL